MGILAAIAGIIGGLCAIVGVLIATDVFTIGTVLENAGWQFWFMLSGILLLGSIAMLLGRRPGEAD